jgi:class 3 adenylate cyclase
VTTNATEATTQAYHQLATYLRRNPEAVNHSSSELAGRFGLPETVVSDVQVAVRERHARRASEGAVAQNLVAPTARMLCDRFLNPLWHRWVHTWRSWTARPSWFVAITSVFGIACVTGLSQFNHVVSAGSTVRIQLDLVSSALVFVVLVLQLLCFYRHGMARHAFYGALVVWVTFSTLAIVTTWLVYQREHHEHEMLTILTLPFVMLVGAAIYAGIGFVFAVIGGYSQVRYEESRREKLGRQQLLERLFEIEERLRRGPTGEPASNGLLDYPLLRRVQRHPNTSAIVLGLSLGILYVFPAAWLTVLHGQGTGSSAFSVAKSCIGVVAAFAWIFAQAGIGFLSGRTARAIVACAFFAVSSSIPMIVPVADYGWGHFVEVWNALWIPLGLLTVAIAVVAGLGAAVEERAARERRLRHNDPATLLAEMLDIHYMLTPTTSLVCIMVVDAARSAEMKAAADPLVVEYSFREYQRMIQDVSERFGGTVHSTAGDGAVVAFPSCTEGFAAAKRIQTDIEDFNRETNRLGSPFRLRVGLHVGRVAGELEKVQFTEVIDIAAHVQTVAPVGGIAMTELVAEQLGGEPAVQLKDPVDGHTVMLVLNPTVDQ